MSIEELVDHLTEQAAQVERDSLAKDRLRRIVINTLNGSLAWAAARTPQPPQGTQQEGGTA